jgi:hypothetical protein
MSTATTALRVFADSAAGGDAASPDRSMVMGRLTQ